MNIKPQQALQRLQEGNERFTSGLRSVESVVSVLKLAELAEKGQKPFAIVLTCADSRVPAETLFDQGVGDLFVIRVAGNIAAPSQLASIEFAALKLGTPLCLVMGHTDCGAIKAAVDREDSKEPLSPSLENLMDRIQPAVQAAFAQAKPNTKPKELVRDATTRNVMLTIEEIRKNSPEVSKLIDAKKFLIVGGVCEISTGKVSYHWPKLSERTKEAS